MKPTDFGRRCLTSCARPLEEGEVVDQPQHREGAVSPAVWPCGRTHPAPAAVRRPARAAFAGSPQAALLVKAVLGLLDRIGPAGGDATLEADACWVPQPKSNRDNRRSAGRKERERALVAEAGRMVERKPGGCANSA